MRTTLNIDDDDLAAAKSITEQRKLSANAALSDLARRGVFRVFTAFDGVAVLIVDRAQREEDGL